MGLESLPGMDVLIEIGECKFTRRQIKEGGYDPKIHDDFVAKNLRFARDCLRAQETTRGFYFTDYQRLAIEWAAIICEDCLPENHPLKKEYPSSDIGKYLAAAREFHWQGKDMPTYFGG